jgi:catechol 2,3-dioxygenase-like lactoylglutathione lyase family enzyme
MDLNQVTIPVLDVARSIAFYQKLGLTLIVRSLPHYARFVCPAGNATFSLHQVEKLPSGEGPWVYFEVADVDEQINTLQQKGIMIAEGATDKPWLWREARIKDPDGNVIIIYHAGKNRLDPPWKVQASP